MEMIHVEEISTSALRSRQISSIHHLRQISFTPKRSKKSEVIYKFTQQNLHACKLSLTPQLVISLFLLMGIIFVPIGFVALHASRSVVEIVNRYDTECMPDEFKSNKVAYIQDISVSKNCTLAIKITPSIRRYTLPPRQCMSSVNSKMVHVTAKTLHVIDILPLMEIIFFGFVYIPKFMKAPIHIYYQLDNYYQNHRRYVKSRNDKQLQYGLHYIQTSSCMPEEYSNGYPIVPCGLVAWSMFNDTYSFVRHGAPLFINRKNISWKSDRDHKFGEKIFPFNFQNGTLIGGKTLDPTIPLSEQEDLMVWMRASALPSFRKIYGRIEDDLDADEVVFVNIGNNYNTYTFGGKKKLVLSTSNMLLGGKNDFLGLSYITTGFSCIFLAVFFALLHVKNQRPDHDTSHFSWTRKNTIS